MGLELKAPSSAVMIRSGLSGANLRNSFARVYAARPLPTITTLLIRFPLKNTGRSHVGPYFATLMIGYAGNSTISKSALATPQSGQSQSSGIDDQAVLGAMPSSGMPTSSS